MGPASALGLHLLGRDDEVDGGGRGVGRIVGIEGIPVVVVAINERLSESTGCGTSGSIGDFKCTVVDVIGGTGYGVEDVDLVAGDP